MRSMNLQIALNRTTAQAAQAKPTAKWKIGDCFFFADRWWCP